MDILFATKNYPYTQILGILGVGVGDIRQKKNFQNSWTFETAGNSSLERLMAVTLNSTVRETTWVL